MEAATIPLVAMSVPVVITVSNRAANASRHSPATVHARVHGRGLISGVVLLSLPRGLGKQGTLAACCPGAEATDLCNHRFRAFPMFFPTAQLAQALALGGSRLWSPSSPRSGD